MKAVKVCSIHKIEKKEIGKNRVLRCTECFNEYRRSYKIINKDKIKEKNKEYNQFTRNRRQEWTENDRKKNPDRYKNYAKKYHEINYVLYQSKRTARKYGLPYEKYLEMIEKSNGKCAICNCEETRNLGKKERLTQLSIDHCHKEQKVRGLICYACNLILGFANDRIDLLNSAIRYLEQHNHI